MKKIFVLAILVSLSLVFATTVSAATLSISPASQIVKVGDIFSVAVTLDTQNELVDGVDLVYLNYDHTLLEVQDASTTVAGIQINPGDLLPSTLANIVDSSLGRITFSQVASAGGNYNSVGTLASISFKAIAAGNASVTFDYTASSTIDSNVASAGRDILGGVSNGSFTISTPPPPASVNPPAPTGGGSSYIPTTPAISNISTTTVGATSMMISWSTSLPTSSQILYGLISIYGSQTSLVSTLTTTHSVTLTNLKTNTIYHFKILSTASGNIAPASDMTFTTGNFSTHTPTGTNIPVATTSASTTQSVIKVPLKITRWLVMGSIGSDVLQLQKALNQNGYVVASIGQGSPNNESTYFGPTTATALGRFQCLKLQVCSGGPYTTGYGATGPRTRQALSQLFVTSTSTTLAVAGCPVGFICRPIAGQPPISTSTVKLPIFTRSLALGSTGLDVKNLQIFLNSKGFTVSFTGVGSKGFESRYFGPATRKAVIKFQIANNITPSVGFFGPLTMKAVNRLIK